jgi:hypothetical protein
LKPIKRKEISQKIADKMNLSLETIDEIINCYFKSVQTKLSSLENERLVVDGFGTFYIKRQKLEDKMIAYKIVLDRLESKENLDMSDFTEILRLKTEIKKFENIFEEIKKDTERKQQKKEQKQNFKNNKS